MDDGCVLNGTGGDGGRGQGNGVAQTVCLPGRLSKQAGAGARARITGAHQAATNDVATGSQHDKTLRWNGQGPGRALSARASRNTTLRS